MNMQIEIDGSRGEGGGQIIRTAITLAAITGKSILIENIRKKRNNPGLRPQHLTAVKILGNICNAKIDGLSIGSTMIRFEPGQIKDCIIKEDIGTAGSVPLILQVVIPVMAICKKKLKLDITGGTDVLWSPTYDYTYFVLKEVYKRMGIEFQIMSERRGYYPKGEGKVHLDISKESFLKPVSLTKRETKEAKLVCSYSRISKEVIESEIFRIKSVIENNGFLVNTKINQEKSISTGASLLIYSMDNNSVIGVDAIFDKKSNSFSKDITDDFLAYNYGVDDNLADMIVLPASLTNGVTIFRVNHITKHLETNLYIASKITGCKYGIGQLDHGYEVRIDGISYPAIQ